MLFRSLALEACEFIADPPRFLGPVPHADDAKLVAGIELGPQRLAEAPRVLCDQRRSGSEDLRGRAVILLEPDHRRAGEILVEAQDIRYLRTAPTVHRRVVATDDTDLLARPRAQTERKTV